MTANRSPDSGDTAVSDADLVRYLDGELTLDERNRLDAVLAGDGALTQRLGVLRRRSARLSELLAAESPSSRETAAAHPSQPATTSTVTASPANATRRAARPAVTPIGAAQSARMPARNGETVRTGQRIWLRAAIVLITVLGGAMAVPPVRAWVIDRLERIGGAEPTPAPSLPASAVSTAPTENFRVAFAVDNASFAIEITATQSSGRLILRSAGGTEASAEVQGRSSGESFLVIAPNHTLRIQNSAQSVADYVITLPASVRDVRVRLAGAAALPVTVVAGGPERVIELAR